MKQPTFSWKCSYLNTIDYEVSDGTGRYTISLRTGVCAYERSIANYDDAGWERDVVGSIDILHRCASAAPISDETVAAFNAWRQAERDAWIATWKANPDRYGPFNPTSDAAQPVPPVKGGHYVVGQGWVVTYDPAMAQAA